MADERQPGQFNYPSMQEKPAAQPADHPKGDLFYPNSPGIDRPREEWQDPLSGKTDHYPSMDPLSQHAKTEDQLFTQLLNSGKPEAFAEAISWIKEDLEELGRMDGAKSEDIAKDLQLVEALGDFVSRSQDPRWRAWAAGMADQIRKTKIRMKGKK